MFKEKNNMAKEIFLTPQGLKELQNELDILKTEKRTEIAEKIKVALSFGDLSENSEYDEAKNDQAKLEARIAEVEAMLKNAKVVEEHLVDKDVVNIGTKFELLDVELGDTAEYQLVGAAESDPLSGKLADDSPVGKAVLGRKAGETVVAETPNGELQFKIVKLLK